jgi:hypothetical protein
VTIANPNPVNVTVQITDPPAAPFGIVNPAACDAVTLAPTESCALTVQFAPDVSPAT